MGETSSNVGHSEIITGEFVTDGTTFVLRLRGTPFSGSGVSASAAYDDLMRVELAAGDLSRRLKELAREQEGETVRATVVRWSLIGLITFGVVAGALIAAAAMAPKVAADIAESAGSRVIAQLEHMPPNAEEKLSQVLQRLDSLLGDTRACPPSSAAAAPGKSP